MPDISRVKTLSLNIKIIIFLVSIGFFLLFVLFTFINPKIKENQYNNIIQKIEQINQITKEKVKIASKSIGNHVVLETKVTKLEIQDELNKIKYDYNIKKISYSKLKIYLKNLSDKFDASIYLFDKTNKLEYSVNTDNEYSHILKSKNSFEYNKWNKYFHQEKTTSYPNKKDIFLYYILKIKNHDIIISSKIENFYKSKATFENDIKKNIQNSFSLTNDIHKGKIYLMWVNKTTPRKNETIFIKDDSKYQEKYLLSKMSMVKHPNLGELTINQLLKSIDKKPIKHKNKNEDSLTWVNSIYDSDKEAFLLVMNVLVKDLNNRISDSFWKVLFISILAFVFAIIIGFFLFQKVLKNINILSNVAKKINQGNINIRSNVKGKDDIGILGITFDTMLDSLEINFKELDSLINRKTKELEVSLNEKEILLKEIHHRVKNNLALTIGFIKLQQNEIKDKSTKNVLNNIQERIFTMELLHRKLYESKNLNLIQIEDYILDLTNDIQTSYQFEQAVNIEYQIDNINLNINYAMPCGLILNEIITNAFKYAFTNIDNPKLVIKMKKSDSTYLLSIYDNGIGLPKDIDIHNSKSLGLKLVYLISKSQLRGEIKYTYEKGSKFEISFSIRS